MNSKIKKKSRLLKYNRILMNLYFFVLREEYKKNEIKLKKGTEGRETDIKIGGGEEMREKLREMKCFSKAEDK